VTASTRVRTDAGTFEVRIDGPADAPWIVLSNSLGATLRMWEPQVPALAQRWRVLRYDTRGHGRSDVPPGPYTIAQLGGDVLELMDALGIARAHYCGLSMGGTTGMWLAAHAPGRLDRVALCNTQPWFGPREVFDDRIATVRREGLGALIDATLQRWFTAEFRAARPEVVARIREDVLATPLAGYVACCEALRDVDLRDDLPRIAVPALVVAGAHDPAPTPAVAREWGGRIAGASFVELPAAHLSNLGASEAFNAALTGFLATR
jgi:3-oxoadipate enol-lactonase